MLSSFRPTVEGDVLPAIRLVANYSLLGPAFAAIGIDDSHHLRLILAAYLLTRAELDPGLLNDLQNAEATEAVVVEVDPAAVSEFGTGVTTKRCDHQIADDRDLWCTAAGIGDETALVTIGGRSAAPTATSICAGCDVPDERVRCSGFTHPSVVATQAFGGLHRRSVSWAICDTGHQDRITASPSMCVPETGHDCWFREVEIGPREPTALRDPLTLPDTLDRLDDVWRLAFESRLTTAPSNLDIAGLALGASTREQLMDRIRALAEVTGALNVDNALIPVGTAAEHTHGSLNRLETAIRAKVDEASELELVVAAVAVLRRVRRIDNSLQHPTGELALRFAEFGVSYPPEDWQHTWDVIRGAVVDALRTIIRSIRGVADGHDAEEDSEPPQGA